MFVALEGGTYTRGELTARGFIEYPLSLAYYNGRKSPLVSDEAAYGLLYSPVTREALPVSRLAGFSAPKFSRGETEQELVDRQVAFIQNFIGEDVARLFRPLVEEGEDVFELKPEPVIEEPVIEEPVIEEPVIEEPVIEEPIIEEPVIEEPIIEEPVIEEPVIEEPVIEEPIDVELDSTDFLFGLQPGAGGQGIISRVSPVRASRTQPIGGVDMALPIAAIMGATKLLPQAGKLLSGVAESGLGQQALSLLQGGGPLATLAGRVSGRRKGKGRPQFRSIGQKGKVALVYPDGTTVIKRVPRPAVLGSRMPSLKMWRRVQKKLHGYRKMAIQVVNRTGGMTGGVRHKNWRRPGRSYQVSSRRRR